PVTLRNTSTAWARAIGGGATGHTPGSARATTRISTRERRVLIQSASILSEVEAQMDAEHGAGELLRQLGKRRRLGDRPHRGAIVVLVATAVLDRHVRDLAVPRDL